MYQDDDQQELLAYLQPHQFYRIYFTFDIHLYSIKETESNLSKPNELGFELTEFFSYIRSRFGSIPVLSSDL